MTHYLRRMPFPKITLLPGKERSLQNRHPWLFSGAVKKMEGDVIEGGIVEIYSSDNRYLATGHYHDGSIKVRIFSFAQVSPDYNFWKEKIQKAYTYRKALGLINSPQTSNPKPQTNIYRLIHAEGDEMPGLIIDIYNKTAVIQTHTIGMHNIKEHLVTAIKEIYGEALDCIYDKSADTMSKQQQAIVKNNFLFGEKKEETAIENGIMFNIDFIEGQKTGFFIDQRQNRKLLSSYSIGKKVLNTFAYSGGFSLYALKAGAIHVDSVDTSKKVEGWTEKNIALNFSNASHRFYTRDVFDFLKTADEDYDVIVLDPPAFAKHLSAVKQATVGYRNLNYEAIRKIKSGGILFTFSCSQVIDKELFRKIVFMAAAQARRNVRIMHQLSQPPDHPVGVFHPEGEYLKGLVLYIE
jgi:23S rRNA (cytosine1962-C5)-methyltransferase